MTILQGAKPRRSADAGISMAELVVSVAVLALLMTLVSTFFVIGSKVTARSDAVGQAGGTISNAMNEISRVVRSGSQQPKIGESLPMPAVIAAAGESLTLYSNIDSQSSEIAPVIVKFALDSRRNLVEERWAPISSSGGYFTFPALSSQPTSRRVIPGPFLPTPATMPPMFSYVSIDGVTITPPTAGFSPAQIRAIAGVTISLRLDRTRANDVGSLELQNTVRFPNLGYTVS